ncbi:MAG: hypothetical protein AB7U61_14165 [Methylocystis sp.]
MEAEYLDSEKGAEHVRRKWGRPCSQNLLTKLACRGGGPTFVKIGRFRAYKVEWLDAWVTAQISAPVRSTSEAGSSRKTRRSDTAAA